ncbi:hypothetical protein GV055_21210 [Marinomonas mediterranea]|nr:hypothetical protein GV055_21210 [Marinomonas mediterranea]
MMKQVVSLLGQCFTQSTHRRTYDKDLPFRLPEWMGSGDIELMARYIRQLFGRQLRYQRNFKRRQV